MKPIRPPLRDRPLDRRRGASLSAAAPPGARSRDLVTGCLAALALVAGGCGTTLLARAAGEPGAVRLPSGSVLRTLRRGDGPIPRPGDRVRVAYEGRFARGERFAQAKVDEPLAVTVEATSPCWREALTRLHVGEQVRLVCDPQATSGEEGPKIPLDVTVDFTLELVGVGGEEPPPKLPPGLVLRSLQAGSGPRPRERDKVKVHYEGRLADGTVFDSSLARGTPAAFSLGSVIPCWRDALQSMRVGEKAELTCPPDIAYGHAGSPPSIPADATLTFQVELIAIER